MTPTFGERLREARQRAGFNSYRDCAAFLSMHGLSFSAEAVGNWERGSRQPHRDDLLPVLARLAVRGGLTDLAQVADLLSAGDYAPLSSTERETHFPTLSDDRIIANVPVRPYHRLIGRESLVDQISGHLLRRDAPRLVVISGLGGIGKTAIAHEVTRAVMGQSAFAAVAWQSLKSEEFISTTISRRQAVTSLGEALLLYGRQLGLDEGQLRADTIRDTLAEHWQASPHLIVLDNLESLPALEYAVREMNDLLGDAGRSRVLITSRQRLAGEPYLVDYPVLGLNETATYALLRAEAQHRRAESLVSADAALLRRIYTITGGMPLAIKLIVSQYLLGISLDDELNRLQAAADEDALYRFIYYDLWAKLSLNAQKLLVGAASVGHALARALLIEASGLTADVFPATVTELSRASLIEVQPHPVSDRQRYDLHPITRWFINSELYSVWQTGNPSAPLDARGDDE